MNLVPSEPTFAGVITQMTTRVSRAYFGPWIPPNQFLLLQRYDMSPRRLVQSL
jgi:hypothetical protein